MRTCTYLSLSLCNFDQPLTSGLQRMFGGVLFRDLQGVPVRRLPEDGDPGEGEGPDGTGESLQCVISPL